ncbi:hypothetical protein [Micromonospora viridifaciens]|uniref:hypothetical protein n=1 Tax=Micromonospora viridifaciens TaxID=1881 RepID=UPI0012FE2534|nr:hypothetical protein [Micromonospora viridifaciens]
MTSSACPKSPQGQAESSRPGVERAAAGAVQLQLGAVRRVRPRTVDDADAVARTGAAIDSIEHGRVYITATLAEVKQITKLGFTAAQLTAPAQVASDGVKAFDFPSGDSLYHNYAETVAEINKIRTTLRSHRRSPLATRTRAGRSPCWGLRRGSVAGSWRGWRCRR